MTQEPAEISGGEVASDGTATPAKTERDRFVALSFCRADMLFELGDTQDVVFAAGATPPLFDALPDELVGRPFIDLVAPADRKLMGQILAAAGPQGRIDDVFVRLNGAQGLTPTAAIAGYRVPDFANHFFLAVKIEPVRAQYVREDDQQRDSATGLLDLGSFQTTATQRVQSYNRAGGRAQMTMFKVDNLAALTQSLEAGEKDRLMTSIGDILMEQSLGGDTAGYVDDEDFSFIHADDVDVDGVSEKIENAARQVHPDGSKVTIRSSTLEADVEGMNEDQVAKVIIHSMQKFCSKNGDLRATSLSESLDQMMSDAVESINYIKEVSKNGDFDLVFMPICDLHAGKVHHFEALTRFKGEHGKQSPYHLISLAEEVGVIQDFDRAVCEKAVDLLVGEWAERPIPTMAVNLSGSSIGDQTFVDGLHGLIDVDPGLADRIMFEITESAEIDDLAGVNASIQGFREKGFKVCLDDFGAGAASFDYLNMLDVDIVKFDGPVVRRACSTTKGNDLLSSMAEMCSNLGVRTVAEMVEDKKMANQIFYCGIDYGQGWHFGKPGPDPFAFADRFADTD